MGWIVAALALILIGGWVKRAGRHMGKLDVGVTVGKDDQGKRTS